MNHLVVFAKAPRLGTVKSRLAADVGWVEATRFYRNTAYRVVRALARDPRWTCRLALAPDTAVSEPWLWPHRVIRLPQGPGDLGDRMGRMFEVAPPGPVVIVGTDIPALSPAHVATAFRALGRYDVVAGPAEDGGYWLIGARRRPAMIDLFRNVRWSTPHALADTLANVPGNRRVKLLDTLADVDDGAGLRASRAPWDRPGGRGRGRSRTG